MNNEEQSASLTRYVPLFQTFGVLSHRRERQAFGSRAFYNLENNCRAIYAPIDGSRLPQSATDISWPKLPTARTPQLPPMEWRPLVWWGVLGGILTKRPFVYMWNSCRDRAVDRTYLVPPGSFIAW